MYRFTYLFKFVANEGKRFVDRVSVPSYGHDSFRTRPVTDIDFGATLKEILKLK